MHSQFRKNNQEIKSKDSLLSKSLHISNKNVSKSMGNTKFLSQSFDVGHRSTGLAGLIPSKGSSFDTDNSNKIIVNQAMKDAYFNQVSYNHWPFTKKSDEELRKNKAIVKDQFGNKYHVEELNMLNENNSILNENQKPSVSTWISNSSDGPRLSLEEREERLKKVRVY